MASKSCADFLDLARGNLLDIPHAPSPRALPRVMTVPGIISDVDGYGSNEGDSDAASSGSRERKIIVANMLPLNTKRDPETSKWCFSLDEDSLLLQLRDGFSPETEVIYVGSIKADIDASEQEEVAKKLLEDFNCVPTFLPQDLQKKFYLGFCKQQLWPLFHYMLPMCPDHGDRFDRVLWQAYVSANKIYADKVMEVITPEDDFVWIHDYHLMIFPTFLRKRYKQVKIGFFLHSPFPSSEIYRTLSVRDEILRGLLNCDLIGFQTFDYARHFLSCCSRMLGLDYESKRGHIGLDYFGRTVYIKILPVGVHMGRLESVLNLSSTASKLKEIKALYEGKKVILGIDDMDIFKGISLKLLAMEQLLLQNPDLLGKVVLIQIVNPARGSGKDVQEAKNETYSTAKRINDVYGSSDYQPVVLIDRHVLRFEKSAYYALAECCIVNAVRDGMNLVPYKYVVCRQGTPNMDKAMGVSESPRTSMLVVSEFIGCSPSLSGAIRVNPWDIEAVADALNSALTMPDSEKQLRHEKHYRYVSTHDVAYWARSFMQDLERACKDHYSKRCWGIGFGLGFRVVSLSPSFRKLGTDQIVSAYRRTSRRAIFLDYDGTVVPETSIIKQPSSEVNLILKTLSDDPRNTVFIVSGRGRSSLSDWLAPCEMLGIAAEHGYFLRDMIRAIRACKTAAEERAVVRKECAAIRASINENDNDYRHRNLAKLMFIHMLGYPTHFGQMECLKLIASTGFPEKRIGYLGLMLLLDERQEVLMLVTNSLKQDLNHSNQYIVGLALCALGNICSAEMARDLAPEVERLLQFRDPNIRKKAALCAIRIIKKVPDLAENFINAAASLLKEKHHGVLISSVQLCTELCKVSSEALEHFRKKCTEGLVRVLKDVANSPYAPEYDISGITDPFLHIRLLKLLRVLGQGDADASDSMNDILAQVATKTESNKNAGNAILYECVQTIMSIEDSGGLRVLAINILGRFLSNRDNNIRYVALNMLMKSVTVDAQAVQRHRVTILECVKDADASIRKRALELVCLLVNETNVKPLTKELIDYLEVSDQDFREDLTEKICFIVEKFSPEKIWYIDQMLKVLSEAGNYVKDEVWHALIVVISNASDLHGYTVRGLYRAFQTSADQETLIRVAIWSIGEYGELLVNNVGMLNIEDPVTVTESDAVDVVETAIKRHSSDVTTKAMALISLLKLSSRFPSCSQRIKDIIVQNKGSLVLELQQRSIEFNSIVEKHKNIRSQLVERMPVLDEATFSGRRTGSLPSNVSTSNGPSSRNNLPNGVSKQPAAAPLVDLLDLSSDDTPAPTSAGGDFLHDLLGVDLVPASTQPGTTQSSNAGTDVLMDLLSIGTSPIPTSTRSEVFSSPLNKPPVTPLDGLLTPPSPTTQSPSTGVSPMLDLLGGFSPPAPALEKNGSVYASITAYESASLKITFDFSKAPGSPETTLIQATYINKSPDEFTSFSFAAAVPRYLQLHLEPSSGNSLPANGNESVTQSFKVINTQHGKKPLLMKMKMSYKANNENVTEEGQVNNFPREL
ncbi:hypothetical protein ACFE04_024165 [Oxalis oulophora]